MNIKKMVGNSVVCRFCGTEIMTADENIRNAPPTAGLYTCSNAAENWEPDCPALCQESQNLLWDEMQGGQIADQSL